MSQEPKASALLLPSDEPPRNSSLRRLLLFFDRVVLPDPDDRALIANDEIVEEFPGGGISKIVWAERYHFPRSPGYSDALKGIQSDLGSVASREVVQFLPLRGPAIAPPKLRLQAYAAAIATPDLVRSAVPDLNLSVTPPVPQSTLLYGGSITKAGHRSEFEVEFRDPYELPESPEWTHLGWLRLARAVKYFDTARLTGLMPVALDEPNTSILLGLSGRALGPVSQPSDIASAAIAAEVVDAPALEAALASMSWPEVMTLRREVLPRVAALRNRVLLLGRRAARASDVSDYRRIVSELASGLEQAREDLRKAWESLRMSAIIRTGGSIATLSVLAVPHGLGAALLSVVEGALAGAALVSDQITGYYAGKRRVQEHPLIFFDELHHRAEELIGQR